MTGSKKPPEQVDTGALAMALILWLMAALIWLSTPQSTVTLNKLAVLWCRGISP